MPIDKSSGESATPAPDDEIDLTSEVPSPAPVETTSVFVKLGFFKIAFRAAGRSTWAPALCFAVIALAVAAGILTPTLLVPAADYYLRLAVCTVAGGLVFAAGVALVVYLRNRSR
jgi:hypothetical protein